MTYGSYRYASCPREDQYIRLTLKPNRPGWSANRRFSIVDLPDPEGPEITMGCRDFGRLSSDSVGAIFGLEKCTEYGRKYVGLLQDFGRCAEESFGGGFAILENWRSRR